MVGIRTMHYGSTFLSGSVDNLLIKSTFHSIYPSIVEIGFRLSHCSYYKVKKR